MAEAARPVTHGRVLKIAIPIVISNATVPILGAVDTGVIGQLGEAAPIFVSRKKGRLSARQLRHAFKVWQERAGFERSFNFHSLRHTACTNLYRATRDIRLTQRFARHKSILSTTIYTHPADEDLVRSVAQLPC